MHQKENCERFHFVEIETSTACNLRCNYCPNAYNTRGLVKNNRQMPEDMFFKVVDDLYDLGFDGEFHPHFYNEPLLDERLPKLLIYVRRRLSQCKIVVFTNGLLLNLNNYRDLAEAGIHGIVVTCHTGSMPPKIAEVLTYREKMGDDGIQLTIQNDGMANVAIFNRGGIIPLGKVIKSATRCTWPTDYLTINYKGNVLLCCNDYNASFPVGNVATHSVAEIWHRPHNIALRDYLLTDTSKIEICRKCKVGYL